MASVQRVSSSHRRRIRQAAEAYIARVIGYGPIAYWPLNETAGLVADNLGTLGAAADGAYTGVTLNNALGPDGVNGAPLFDGTNDYVDIHTAALSAAFNGATGSMAIWCRVANAGIWTEGATRYAFHLFSASNDYYRIYRDSYNNRLVSGGRAGGGSAVMIRDGLTTTDWFHIAVTWSDGANADQVYDYYNGSPGTPSTSLNAWTGVGLAANLTLIGAYQASPTLPWNGWLAHAAVWDHVLTPAQILDLATV
jgi:hypothetical protein